MLRMPLGLKIWVFLHFLGQDGTLLGMDGFVSFFVLLATFVRAPPACKIIKVEAVRTDAATGSLAHV